MVGSRRLSFALALGGVGAAALLAAAPRGVAGSAAPGAHDHSGHAGAGAQAAGSEGGTAPPVTERLVRQGIAVDFSARPAPGRATSETEILAGEWVDVSFRLSDADSGQPLKGQFPGAWVDLARSWKGDQALGSSCKDRVAQYLQGLVGVRPLIDMNSYFLLVMNRDPSISVIDPITGVAGITKLYAQVNLKQPGGDWAKTADEKRFFVTMPRAGEVAVVDTDTFKVVENVAAGSNPVRTAVQPDGRYLWVGNDGDEAGAGGVTVIDTQSLEPAARLATGGGHHELAFSSDGRFAFVSNDADGTVSVIDVRRLEKVRDVATGPSPRSLAYSSLSESLYVSDSETGEIAVLRGRGDEVARLRIGPGLGALRFSQDGRWAIALDAERDLALVIDPATNQVVHSLAVGRHPHQVAFSRSFAYVRSLGTERVAMIDLSEIGKDAAPPVVTFAAGQRPPEQARDQSVADAVVEAPGEAAVLVVSPADATVYYYMEGMNAPMGNFRNYGHMPVAVQVADRSMQEREPGVYSSTIRVPDAGTYEVAFLLDSPSVLHCFEVKARPNPLLARTGPSVAVEFLNPTRRVAVGERVDLRFRVTERDSGRALPGLDDVRVHYFAAPGGQRLAAAAHHAGDGIYESVLTLGEAGAYYVYVGCPSQGLEPTDLAFTTLVAGGAGRWR